MRLEKYGKHFILALSGTEITTKDIDILSSIKPSGIFLDSSNFDFNLEYEDWLEKLEILITNAKKYIENDNLIIAIDHEGGRVHRVPPPLTKFPYASEYKDDLKNVCSTIERELSSIGINLLFGPCADINSNPNNPVIGERAFSDNPKEVSKCCLEYINNFSKLECCPKHFPGHGDTDIDSHLELPIINKTLAEIGKNELIPFRDIINNKINFIMTAHIKIPSIDNLPATLSTKIINGILREAFRYQGIVITDDLDMKAIADNYSEEDIAKLGINAGCDLFLLNHNPEKAIKISKEMKKLAESDENYKKMLELSEKRIQNIKNLIVNNRIHKIDFKNQ